MTAPSWKTRAEFQKWWRTNVIEFNALAIKDPAAWEEIAKKVEAFQTASRGY